MMNNVTHTQVCILRWTLSESFVFQTEDWNHTKCQILSVSTPTTNVNDKILSLYHSILLGSSNSFLRIHSVRLVDFKFQHAFLYLSIVCMCIYELHSSDCFMVFSFRLFVFGFYYASCHNYSSFVWRMISLVFEFTLESK